MRKEERRGRNEEGENRREGCLNREIRKGEELKEKRLKDGVGLWRRIRDLLGITETRCVGCYGYWGGVRSRVQKKKQLEALVLSREKETACEINWKNTIINPSRRYSLFSPITLIIWSLKLI